MSNLVPTLLLTAMIYALGAGIASLPGHPAGNTALAHGAHGIPTLPTIVVRPDEETTVLPTITVHPSAAELAEAASLDERDLALALHAIGGGMSPGSGMDMPYYSFGKSVYRLRKE